ncbi:MAG TPA: thiamine pyrophosphate-binding protein [Spirochaetota bacterium]|nr:thiamine pyrophosphate-binding protein [Spirochaetota bacterium]
MNSGDVIASVLKEEGVRRIFTLCGGHISPILVGCKKIGIEVIDTRDEANAVFAADATARMTGVPGVAAVTAGPGVTNTVTALVNAHLAQSPLVLLGAAATVLKGRGSLQDIDQRPLIAGAVKRCLAIKKTCDVVPVLENAFRIAKSGVPGPVFVECPIDLLYEEEIVRAMYGAGTGASAAPDLRTRLLRWYLNRHVDRMYSCELNAMKPEKTGVREIIPGRRRVKRAANMIAGARKPLMILGSQAMLHAAEAQRLPEAVRKIGVPVYLTGMARGLLGKNDPLQFRHHRKEALREADLVVLAGIPFDFRLDYGRAINPRARVISVNRSRRELTMNRRPAVPVHADPFTFLMMLAETGMAPAAGPEEWLSTLRSRESQRELEIEAVAGEKGAHVNPVRFLKKLEERITDASIIVADGGDFVATASYIIRPPAPLSWLDPGVFGTLGVGAGFAMGAAAARPGSDVWIIYGDGAAGYTLQEFDTFARHGMPVIAVIGNDACWSQIYREQVVYYGDDVGTRLAYSDYHTVAEAYGGAGFVIQSEDRIDLVLDEAIAAARSGKPVIVNVWINRTEFRKGSISM